MAKHVFTCVKGHHTDHFTPIVKRTPMWVRCGVCRSAAHLNARATYLGQQLTCDVPEHFNPSIGMPVKSRRHLKELQLAHGFRDYEKDSKLKSSNWKEKGRRTAAGKAGDGVTWNRELPNDNDPAVAIID